jgi:hypothetical protein
VRVLPPAPPAPRVARGSSGSLCRIDSGRLLCILERLRYHCRRMAKNPNAVALGRLGGTKGGAARAKALSARRRSSIASLAGKASAQALSAAARAKRSRRAARARWRKAPGVVTAMDAPESVRRLLKTYDPAALRWDRNNDRYAVVVAILTRGNRYAKQWLWRVVRREDVRDLVRQYAGSGCAEPDRAKLRRQLRLTTDDIPTREYLGFQMGQRV